MADEEKIPPEKMSPEELLAYVATVTEERDSLGRRLNEALIEKRKAEDGLRDVSARLAEMPDFEAERSAFHGTINEGLERERVLREKLKTLTTGLIALVKSSDAVAEEEIEAVRAEETVAMAKAEELRKKREALEAKVEAAK